MSDMPLAVKEQKIVAAEVLYPFCLIQIERLRIDILRKTLWNTDTAPLPIEQKDYIIECPVDKFDILVQGEDDFGGVTIFNNSVHYYQDKPFLHLFNDMAGYYSKFAYNSRAGFALSTRDRTSFDSMISLMTSDGRMGSHRTEVLNLKKQSLHEQRRY